MVRARATEHTAPVLLVACVWRALRTNRYKRHNIFISLKTFTCLEMRPPLLREQGSAYHWTLLSIGVTRSGTEPLIGPFLHTTTTTRSTSGTVAATYWMPFESSFPTFLNRTDWHSRKYLDSYCRRTWFESQSGHRKF
jgi:hypothetical protein